MTKQSTFTKADFEEFPSRYRAHFFNGLIGFKSAPLVGSISENGVENLAIFSQLVHVGSNPPYMGVLFRPHSVRRDTLENIRNTKHFTINHVSEAFYEKAHQTAAKYEGDENEFEKVGLTAEYGSNKAPYVKESLIQIGLEFAEEQIIKVNNTILIVGAVSEVRLPNDIIKKDGFIDLTKANVIANSDLDAYYSVQKLGRLNYAKPDQKTTHLPKDLF
ncbi:flavin reductase family protein [Salibacter sp.]|uniref:flavin reductase family protein n=1 Tax=Salibacter sp. TaxID=2010995 RepID=UPI002870199C|nr:flavin reductase family protein [Salibacter sp.]MDR9398600.1 flavin reductase family protein [Salibacter sp.]MDR9487846.1 flavin reductase family protein [Salibacter sp.]